MDSPPTSQHTTPQHTSSPARPWLTVIAGATALGLLALLTNLSTTADLHEHAELRSALRQIAARLANSGIAWAGLLVWAGWVVARPARAVVAGPAAGLVALTVYYGLATLTDAIPARITDNLSWFAASLVIGPPLALIGTACRRTSLWGWLARLVVPVGAIAEPFVRHSFDPAVIRRVTTNPALISHAMSGAILLACGIMGTVLVAVHRDREPQPGTRREPHARATLTG